MEQVRVIIGDERTSGFPDDEVKRVVWNHYFDVGQSVSKLLGMCTILRVFLTRELIGCTEEQERRAVAEERKGETSIMFLATGSSCSFTSLSRMSIPSSCTLFFPIPM